MQEAQKAPWLVFPLSQVKINCWQIWQIHRKMSNWFLCWVGFFLFLFLFFFSFFSLNSASWLQGKSKQKFILKDLKSMFILPQAHSLTEFSSSFAFPSTKPKFPPPLNLQPSSSPEAPLLIIRSLCEPFAPGWSHPHRICSTKCKGNRQWIILLLSQIISPSGNRSSVAVNSGSTAHKSWTTACRNQYHWL